MKFEPRLADGDVNVPKFSLLGEFVYLALGLLAIGAGLYAALGLAVDIIVPHLPQKAEESLGSHYSAMYEKITPTAGTARLQSLLDGLVKESGLKGPYRVYLSPAPVMNALAAPGGNIIFYKGLYNRAKDDYELSYVLGHELGHFAARDHLRGVGRGLVLFALSSALLGTNSDTSGFILRSLQGTEMTFSRERETQADLYAVDLLAQKYGFVKGVTQMLEVFEKEEGERKFLFLFASHPASVDRIEAVRKYSKEMDYTLK